MCTEGTKHLPKFYLHFTLKYQQCGYTVRSKNYENGHKNTSGLVCFRIKGRKQQSSDFQSHFSKYIKNQPNPSLLFFFLRI